MKSRRIVSLLAVLCVWAVGCAKETTPNTPTEQSEITVQNTADSAAPGDDYALPSPELVENGQDGQVSANAQPPEPVVEPPKPQVDDSKWDIALPQVELATTDGKNERTAEVENQLKKDLKAIESGDLSFLNERAGYKASNGAVYYPSVNGSAQPMVQAKAYSGSTGSKKASAKKSAGRGSAMSGGGAIVQGARAPKPEAMMMESAPAAMGYGSGGGGIAGGGAGAAIIGNDIAPIKMNTDEYSQYDPNRFMSVAANPLSTFGADVDTASYGVFRRSVNEGRVPRNQALRAEEMINYFKYDYPNPKAGEPFSVTTEISECPWNKDTKLFLVGAKTRDLDTSERPASNIVFLFDISGSMSGTDRLALLKASVISMLPKLTANDRISIVTYSGSERFIIDGVPGDHHATILKALDLFRASGVTNGERGIQMAYAVAKKNFIKGGNNRIIMGTDGDLNVGISNTNELKALIEKKRETGIFLSVLGVGSGNYKDNRLEALADYGNGSYHYIDSLREGKRVLVDEFMSTVFVAAKDVKFQVDFNPNKIKGYRQIGYETRRLNAEDFADDKKDGGEVGAGHQVTILYEIVETGSKVDVPEPASKYQKPQNVQSDEYATVKLRYKKPDGDVSSELSWPVTASAVTSKMSANLNFASAVAAVTMILNNSPFKGTASYDNVLKQLKDIKSLDDNEYRAEFVALVRRLKGL